MIRISLLAASRAAAAALFLALLPLAASAQDGDGQTMGPMLSSDEPVQIESDKLEVHQKQNTAVFSGNVSVVQGDTLLKAGKLTVHYADKEKGEGGDAQQASASASLAGADTSRIESIEAEGQVYVKSKDQVATGDHGRFDMKTRVLVLSGDEVVLTQGDNVLVGCQLTVQMNSGEAKLESCGDSGSGRRVKMLLKPSSEESSQISQ